MTGRELRAWRKQWFPETGLAGRTQPWGRQWSIHRAAMWAGVPEKRWMRWERPSHSVPEWVVNRMNDPWLNPAADAEAMQEWRNRTGVELQTAKRGR